MRLRYFDLHCDTITECLLKKQSLYENPLHLSLKKGAMFSPWFQCFAAWIPDTLRGADAIRRLAAIHDNLLKQISRYPDKILLCKTAEDIHSAQLQKKCGAVFTLEGGAALGGDLDQVETLVSYGIKMVTLTWNGTNEIGDGALVSPSSGITKFGRLAVQKMAEKRIAIDLSHASDKLFFDTLEACPHGKFLATHSNSRTVCKHPRNLTDEQFAALKERDGIVGINFCPNFLNSSPDRANMDDIIRHVDYFLSLGGEKNLAIGSDFDGTDMPTGISGVESITILADYFARHHYSDELIDALFFQNAYRFMISL